MYFAVLIFFLKKKVENAPISSKQNSYKWYQSPINERSYDKLAFINHSSAYCLEPNKLKSSKSSQYKHVNHTSPDKKNTQSTELLEFQTSSLATAPVIFFFPFFVLFCFACNQIMH